MTDAGLIDRLHANGGGEMWAERAVELVNALDGSGVDPRSKTLLDDMDSVRLENPKISEFLYRLPGHKYGDMATAERHLSYLTGQIQ